MPLYRRPAFAALSTTNLPSVSRRSGSTSPQPPTPRAKPKPLSLPWLPKPELWRLSIFRAGRAKSQRTRTGRATGRRAGEGAAQNTRGQPLEEFVAAALVHSDRLDQDIDSLDRRTQQLDPDIAAAEAEALRAEQVLNTYQQASDSAAEARQQAELIVGRLQEHVIEYAALHLARVALDRAKERYRARQSRLFTRSSRRILQNANRSGVRGARHRQRRRRRMCVTAVAPPDIRTRASRSADSPTAPAINSSWPSVSRD